MFATSRARHERPTGVGTAGAVLAALIASLTGCHGSGLAFSPPSTVSTATGVGTAPMLAVAADGRRAVAWVSAPDSGTDGRLFVSVGGARPVELTDTLGPVEAHGESPPKLAFGPDGVLYALYVVVEDVPDRRFPLAALRMIRSRDSGRTWSDPVSVNGGSTFGVNNFHALHVAANGTLYVAWLGGDPGKSGSWVTRSDDGGTTWLPAVEVDSGLACPCCRTALATAADGTLYLAWRHVFPGQIRDIVVARSTDGGREWSPSVRVHADNWEFNGCPHAGPSLQVDERGTVHVAWWTGKSGAAGVWYARSTDRGRSFLPAIPLGVGASSMPAHVQLALSGDSIVAAVWDDGVQAHPAIAFRISHNGGRTFTPAEWLSDRAHRVGFPVIAIAGRQVSVAWATDAATGPAKESSGSMTHKGLTPVGDGQVLLRTATLP